MTDSRRGGTLPGCKGLSPGMSPLPPALHFSGACWPPDEGGGRLAPTLLAAPLPSGAYLVFPPQLEEIPEGWSHEGWSRAGWSPG